METKTVSLSNIEFNRKYVIDKINCTGNTGRRLYDLGFFPGSIVISAFSAPFGDPVAYKICGSTVALRKETSEKIFVVRIPPEVSSDE